MFRLLGSTIAVCTLLGCQAENENQDMADKNTCNSEAVIMVVAGETLDRQRMGEYAAALAESGLYPKAQGYYLNAPRPVAVFEGDVPENYATLMVRFPSLEVAQTFWNSDAYQNDIRPIRLNPSAGHYTVTVYREADLPDYMRGKVGDGRYNCQSE